MITLRDPTEHRFGKATFPLTPRWDVEPRLWHRHYPRGVAPGFDFAAERAEWLFLNMARRYPRRVALRYFTTQWTYGELLEHVQRAARSFLDAGVRTRDRVLTVLPNTPEFVVTWFALHWIGAEIVPANPLMSAKDLVLLAEQTDAHAVFGLDLKLGAIAGLLERHHVPLLIVTSLRSHLPAPLRWGYSLQLARTRRQAVPQRTVLLDWRQLQDDTTGRVGEPVLTDAALPAVLQPTGGTTGVPKVAVLTHANLHANVAQLHVWSGRDPGAEVVLSILPFFHVFGATVCLLSGIAGGSTLLLQARFDPRRVYNIVRRWKPTCAPMVPFMFRALNEEMRRRGRNLEGLDFCFSGAAPMPEDVKEEFERRTGARVFEGFGLSEASPVTHANPPDHTARCGSIGLPLPGTDARIVDEEDGERDLPPGAVGELLIRGPQVMSGYLDCEEENDRTLQDGWLRTGDLAVMDTEGFFRVVDRKKDLIITGGLNVFPTEVEEWLVTHPKVAEAAVVGLPDDAFGQRVAAYVVPTRGATPKADELREFCRQGLARYKIPRTIEVREELPKNFLGKVRRIELRSEAA